MQQRNSLSNYQPISAFVSNVADPEACFTRLKRTDARFR